MAVGVGAAGTASPKRGTAAPPGDSRCARQSATLSSKRMGLRPAAPNCPGAGAKRTKPKQRATVQKTVKVRINKTRAVDGGPRVWIAPGTACNDVAAWYFGLGRYYLNFGLPAVSMRFRSAVGIMCKSARDPDR